MRIGLAAMVAACLVACGEDAEETADIATITQPQTSPIEAPEAVGTTPLASHGGTMVEVGDTQIEVVTHDDGNLEAYVDSGLEAPRDAHLTVRVATEGGAIQPVVMIWDPSADRFRGRLHSELPVPGPLEVELTAGGVTTRGSSDYTVILPPEPAAAVAVGRGSPDRPAAPEPTPPSAPVAARTPTAPRASPPAAPVNPPVVAAPRGGAPPGPPPPRPPGPPPPPPARVRVRAVQQATDSRAQPPAPGPRPRARVRVRATPEPRDDDDDD